MPHAGTALSERVWDVIVIGAGMGGGMVARTLLDAGHDVLLVDRGHGTFPLGRTTAAPPDERRMAKGEWPTGTSFEVDGRLTHVFGIMGCGIGGGSNIYAAALERFERHDVDALPGIPHVTGGWPIHYDELLPYYEKAERLLHVAGTADPLNGDSAAHLAEPPPLGPRDAALMDDIRAAGLHPYRLHVGIRYLPGCDECLGRLCYRECRVDIRTILAAGRRQPVIVDQAEVLRLEATVDHVDHVLLRRHGQEQRLKARIFVLAAGAIHTPGLLLRSAGPAWPDGLANHSGMVGRNLMCHAVDRIAIWSSRPPWSIRRLEPSGPRKSIGFRDFYLHDGERLGSVQSTGFGAGYGAMLMGLRARFDRGPFRRLRPLRPLLRVRAWIIVRWQGPATVFAAHIEDRPYPDNRVILDPGRPDGVRLVYRVPDELRRRVARFRTVLKRRLKARRLLFLSHGVELNHAHCCGTCVMGDDPATSVVDREGRAHGIDNLFIADGSFMPSSGATNPGLTIAAHALRVADGIERRMRAMKQDA